MDTLASSPFAALTVIVTPAILTNAASVLSLGTGTRRLHILLEREGLVVNHKRVHRLYRAAGLQVRPRQRKRLTRADRVPLPLPSRPRERWSMDFTTDTLAFCLAFLIWSRAAMRADFEDNLRSKLGKGAK